MSEEIEVEMLFLRRRGKVGKDRDRDKKTEITCRVLCSHVYISFVAISCGLQSYLMGK